MKPTKPKKTCGSCENSHPTGKDGVVLCKMRVPMWHHQSGSLIPTGKLMRSDEKATKCEAFRWMEIK